MEKFLYFRNVAAVADDDNIEDSVCYPVSKLIGMVPSDNSVLKLTFDPVQRPSDTGVGGAADSGANLPLVDTVLVNLSTANTHRKVIANIARKVATSRDPFITVADDAVDDTPTGATYLACIASCGTITHNAAFTN